MIGANEDPEDDKRPPAPAQSTPQAQLELDPAAHDSGANQGVDTMAIDPASLFEQALEQTRMAITLTDPHREGNPIVYANQAFLELTGYAREEILGRNCRFLQGPETNPAAVAAIRKTLKTHKVQVIEILNYRKDGTAFWNALHIGPIFDAAGALTHFYGSQWDITDTVEKRARLALQAQVAEELTHRTSNLFNVIASIVRLSARGEDDVERLVVRVEGRIRALGRAHAISISREHAAGEAADLGHLVAAILEPYQAEGTARVRVSGARVEVPSVAITPIGLMLHELATNALKYGAFSAPDGTVTVAWERTDDRLSLHWKEEGGPKVVTALDDGSGTGARIMEGVLRMIGAELRYDWSSGGLNASLQMPLAAEE